VQEFVFWDAQVAQEMSTLARFNSVLVDSSGRFACADGSSGEFVACGCAADVQKLQDRTMGGHSDVDVFIVDTQAENTWSVIPSENLIAIKQQDACRAKFIVVVTTCDEAIAMLNLLDTGMDGVLLRSNDHSEISRYGLLRTEHEALATADDTATALATILEVRRVGTGDRACLDFCSLLDENEGVFVGSSSQAMFLVLSEAAKNDYVPSRAFRCNAGPVHSYVLCANGRTKYLAELRAGDEVLVIKTDSGGISTRKVVLGRVKIENRPLVLVQAALEPQNIICNILLQNAETVRLACALGDTTVGRSIVELAPGDRVPIRLDSAARHLGMPIQEYIVEN
jgi:3-dehydroquinate synthase II